MLKRIQPIKRFLSKKKKLVVSYSKKLAAWAFNHSGLKYIWENQIKKKPSTFLIWLIGIHIALFGLASQRYENRVDVIEYRGNAVISQISASELRSKALERIPEIQRMECPGKPELIKFWTVYTSLLGKDTHYSDMVFLLKEAIEDNKMALEGLNLSSVILDDANLEGAKLKNAHLERSSLQSIKLNNADMEGTYFLYANLNSANLSYSKLQGAKLWGANLRNSDILFADLQGASLDGADFENANLLGADLRGTSLGSRKTELGQHRGDIEQQVEQLSKTQTLYRVQLDPILLTALQQKYSRLFEKPDYVIEDSSKGTFTIDELKRKAISHK
jgi:hypothetical protein